MHEKLVLLNFTSDSKKVLAVAHGSTNWLAVILDASNGQILRAFTQTDYQLRRTGI